MRIDDIVEGTQELPLEGEVYLVVNRLQVNQEPDTISRIAESVETAFYEGEGQCFIEIDGTVHSFSNRFEENGVAFSEPSVNMFSFNSPIGACPRCEGYGKILGIDENLVIPNKSLSVYEDAVMCWRGEKRPCR